VDRDLNFLTPKNYPIQIQLNDWI